MKAPSLASRILLVLLATLMLTFSAALAWGVVLDYQARGLVSKGVTVVGHDLSGMTEAQARATIEDAVSAPMLRPVTITGDNKSWTLDPASYVSVGVDSMLEAAYSPRRSASFVQRLNSQLRGDPLPAEITPVYSVDSTAVAAWVAQTSAQVDRKSVNSTRKLVKYSFKISPCFDGAKVNQPSSARLISQSLTADAALASASRVVTLPITAIKPKVTPKSFKLAITVSLSECRIRLFNGAKLVRSYPCAPGRPAYPTPTGDFKIVSKQRYASWINPGSPWAASMPPVIGPGPSNPMGTTKIGINWPGVYMHGVPPGEFGSIGTHSSHACMRMFPSDVLDLYHHVNLGTPVFIRD